MMRSIALPVAKDYASVSIVSITVRLVQYASAPAETFFGAARYDPDPEVT